ncbi:DinB family protein [Actinoalloteichus caeruleus]|uniref:DinB family protein n=1 Tax=Actinoalloteichus cyanogriseus TaxID=2893586 RepID=UPI0004AAF882|nr:DinB family protein [Actinoalloteichus caeruleus]
MTLDRQDPAESGTDRELLTQFLDFHRATLRLKCDGLSPDRLATRSAPPSVLSLLGLVRHLADVERYWFRRVLGQQDLPARFYSTANRDGDFLDITPENVTEAEVERAWAAWREEVDHARSLVEATDLDALRQCPPRDGRQVSLRWILVHMVEEYARHNGHADLLREALDGTVGE